VMLAGSVLGARRGFLALLLFLVLVAVGLPVLPGGRGGLAVFAGVTAGYLAAWPLGALVTGWLTERLWRRYTLARGVAANVAGGMVAIYLVGVPVLAVAAHLPLRQAVVAGALPFLAGDAVKAVVAAAIAVQVRRRYPVIESPRRGVAAS